MEKESAIFSYQAQNEVELLLMKKEDVNTHIKANQRLDFELVRSSLARLRSFRYQQSKQEDFQKTLEESLIYLEERFAQLDLKRKPLQKKNIAQSWPKHLISLYMKNRLQLIEPTLPSMTNYHYLSIRVFSFNFK